MTAVGWLCFFGGLWLFWTALRARARRVALLRNCVRVQGKVIRVVETTTEGDTVATYSPVVQYRTNAGSTHEMTLLPRQHSKACRVGAIIPVFYDKTDPLNAADAKRMWDVNLACALSLLPILLGIGLIYTALQESRDPPLPLREGTAASRHEPHQCITQPPSMLRVCPVI